MYVRILEKRGNADTPNLTTFLYNTCLGFCNFNNFSGSFSFKQSFRIIKTGSGLQSLLANRWYRFIDVKDILPKLCFNSCMLKIFLTKMKKGNKPESSTFQILHGFGNNCQRDIYAKSFSLITFYMFDIWLFAPQATLSFLHFHFCQSFTHVMDVNGNYLILATSEYKRETVHLFSIDIYTFDRCISFMSPSLVVNSLYSYLFRFDY